jgi:DNA-binding response OmpR family regulator
MKVSREEREVLAQPFRRFAACRIVTACEEPPMVLMLTAADQPVERVAGLRLGADDYLGKPFHCPELVLRVRVLARRKPTAHGHILQAAGIELDPLRRTPATAVRSASRSRSSECSRRSSSGAPPT